MLHHEPSRSRITKARDRQLRERNRASHPVEQWEFLPARVQRRLCRHAFSWPDREQGAVDRSNRISFAKYQSFIASDIKVRFFQDMAIATCLWSSRSIIKGQAVSYEMRTMHVYLNGASGWHAISGQNTSLPPDVSQPL